MRLAAPPPALSLLIAGVVCIAVAMGAILLATSTPWLGLRTSSKGATVGVTIVRVDPNGPAAALSGKTLLAVGDIILLPTDALDEPDYLPDYRAARAFFDRQTRLHQALAASPLRLTIADEAGRSVGATLTPRRRPVSSLPADFWIQIGFGLGSFLIAAWVWALRPKDSGAVLFGLSGLGMLISTGGAAVYSTRELALDGDLFRALSGANHTGALLFAYVMACLFLVYPRRRISTKLIVALSPLPLAWLLADIFHIAGDAQWGAVAPLLLLFAIIAAAVVVQWRATRHDPVGRAALRWLGLSVVIGAGSCVATYLVPGLLGGDALVPQSYAFGFFFLIYVAMAVGLRRSRAFQLDEWAFRIAFYAGAGLLLVIIDGLLIILLRAGDGLSLGVSLLAVAFLYLPSRDWLWRRLIVRRRISDEDLFGQIVDTALAVHPTERDERWRSLLTKLFDPLQIENSAEPQAEVAILADGLAMALPATSASPALVLRAPWAGRGLFGPSHLRLARKAMDMIARTETRRDAYERGAAEERQRIAQDLHDDVGSLLLSGLHKTDLHNTRQVIRDAMFDVRILASELGGQRREVGDLLADLRHEALERLGSAGLIVDWPPAEGDAPVLMDFAVYKAVRSSVRELMSNIIRHAGASHVTVAVSETGDSFAIEISDNGCGRIGTARPGMGLAGVSRRMQAVAGSLALPPEARGMKAVLTFPLQIVSEIGTPPIPTPSVLVAK